MSRRELHDAPDGLAHLPPRILAAAHHRGGRHDCRIYKALAYLGDRDVPVSRAFDHRGSADGNMLT